MRSLPPLRTHLSSLLLLLAVLLIGVRHVRGQCDTPWLPIVPGVDLAGVLVGDAPGMPAGTSVVAIASKPAERP